MFVAPSFSWPHAFALFTFGSIWKTKCTANEFIRWINSKHGSLQTLQMLQRMCYTGSGKGWAIGPTYAKLRISLSPIWEWKCCKKLPILWFRSWATGVSNSCSVFGRPWYQKRSRISETVSSTWSAVITSWLHFKYLAIQRLHQRVDDKRIGVQFRAQARDLSSLHGFKLTLRFTQPLVKWGTANCLPEEKKMGEWSWPLTPI
jgi:hypothetical protein